MGNTSTRNTVPAKADTLSKIDQRLAQIKASLSKPSDSTSTFASTIPQVTAARMNQEATQHAPPKFMPQNIPSATPNVDDRYSIDGNIGATQTTFRRTNSTSQQSGPSDSSFRRPNYTSESNQSDSLYRRPNSTSESNQSDSLYRRPNSTSQSGPSDPDSSFRRPNSTSQQSGPSDRDSVVDAGRDLLIPYDFLRLEKKPFAEGGGGQVFRGEYFGSAIAAKRIFGQEAQKDLEKEASVLSKLSHPSIVNYYGICDNGDYLFMIMEFCDGGDLASYYETELFTPDEFCRVVTEFLNGILYLHQNKVAHRDLKPANVLLQSASKKVKIADFGLAKQNRNTATRGVGTMAYMPPEMFAEVEDSEDYIRNVNLFAVDVYAVGIILWQLWFKQQPYKGKSATQIASLLSRNKRPEPSGGAGSNQQAPPTALTGLISACWDTRPENRPDIKALSATFMSDVRPQVKSQPQPPALAQPAGPARFGPQAAAAPKSRWRRDSGDESGGRHAVQNTMQPNLRGISGGGLRTSATAQHLFVLSQRQAGQAGKYGGRDSVQNTMQSNVRGISRRGDGGAASGRTSTTSQHLFDLSRMELEMTGKGMSI